MKEPLRKCLKVAASGMGRLVHYRHYIPVVHRYISCSVHPKFFDELAITLWSKLR
jgi:hypothetical protein